MTTQTQATSWSTGTERENYTWHGAGSPNKGVCRVCTVGQGQATHLVEGCGVLAEALGQGSQEVVVACMAAPQVAGHRNDCHQGVVLEI